MLFDLRGRGRRNTVRVIYIGLAVLIGVGLVGFGIGNSQSGGGLLNAATKNEGSGSASYTEQIKKYSKLASEQPNNAHAWEQLTNAQLHQAGGEAYVTQTGVVTSKGKALFGEIAESWNHYIALAVHKPNPELAQRVVVVFGEEGLNEPAAAVSALQIAVAARPTSAALFGSLAEYAYKAKNPRVGDLAAARAVSLAPAASRVRLQAELAAIKKNPSGKEGESTAVPSVSTTATGSTK